MSYYYLNELSSFYCPITVSAIHLALWLLFTLCILCIALFSWLNKLNDDDDDDESSYRPRMCRADIMQDGRQTTILEICRIPIWEYINVGKSDVWPPYCLSYHYVICFVELAAIVVCYVHRTTIHWLMIVCVCWFCSQYLQHRLAAKLLSCSLTTSPIGKASRLLCHSQLRINTKRNRCCCCSRPLWRYCQPLSVVELTS